MRFLCSAFDDKTKTLKMKKMGYIVKLCSMLILFSTTYEL